MVRAEKPWGEVFTEAEARAFLEKERPQVVAFVHGEILYRRACRRPKQLLAQLMK